MINSMLRKLFPAILFVLILFTCSCMMTFALQNDTGSAENQRHFSTPEEAVDALVTACKGNNSEELMSIFGNNNEALINTGDEALDCEMYNRFYELAMQKKTLRDLPDGSKELVIGEQEWPFPVPLVKDSNGWYLDTEAGYREILQRRIGENEMRVIDVCSAYVEAQKEYAAFDRDGDRVLEYAQRLRSTNGKTDGLYWLVDPDNGVESSPMGPMEDDEIDHVVMADGSVPVTYNGYRYRILTRQGTAVSGTASSYVKNGNMTGGHALVAYPAVYGSTGVMTFVVNQQGVVYSKDLGPNTVAIAQGMKEYNPDKTWKVEKKADLTSQK